MALQLKPLHPVFVAEASGLDLTQPLADADVRAINAAMNRYGGRGSGAPPAGRWKSIRSTSPGSCQRTCPCAAHSEATVRPSAAGIIVLSVTS